MMAKTDIVEGLVIRLSPSAQWHDAPSCKALLTLSSGFLLHGPLTFATTNVVIDL